MCRSTVYSLDGLNLGESWLDVSVSYSLRWFLWLGESFLLPIEASGRGGALHARSFSRLDLQSSTNASVLL